MAEIKIQNKKPIWAWVSLILVILIVVAYIIYVYQGDNNNKNDDNEFANEKIIESTNSQMGGDTGSANNAFGASYSAYTAFVESIKDSTRIAVDSSYTKMAFSNLTKVVVNKADESSVADSKALDDLRNYSVLITSIAKTSTNMENFKNFKTACDKIASVLGDIQAKSYPALRKEVSDLQQIASKISVSIPMDKQQADIDAFLKKSRDVLRAMNP